MSGLWRLLRTEISLRKKPASHGILVFAEKLTSSGVFYMRQKQFICTGSYVLKKAAEMGVGRR
jgi:hypothetical protein